MQAQDTLIVADGASPDTLVVHPDTVVVDTVDVITAIGREFAEAGELVLAGEYGLIVARIVELVVDFVPRLLGAILVIMLFWIGYRLINSVLKRVLRTSRRAPSGVESLLLKGFRVVVVTFAIVMVLGQLGLNITALVAGLGIAGIALGFAARDTLENFISGVTILLDQPFRVGDNVEVSETFGRVEEITLRSTRVRTRDNELVILPNNQMINQKLINHSILGVLRIRIPFGIAYKEYPQKARDEVIPLVKNDPRIHPDFPPQVVVTKLNDSSVDMELRIWLKDPMLEYPVRFEYIEKVREALRKADIEIPFPHRQLFIDEAKAFDNVPPIRTS